MPGMKNTMAEFAAGKLHSGSKRGPVVKEREQAIAIGLSEQRAAQKKGKVKERPRKRPRPRSGDLIRRAMEHTREGKRGSDGR